ncbi:MAG TPA: RNA-binding S4 domain-containing protein [Edaphocola sp.]|nr:RNA-binding S4 domain-containing protein [Edaphocola sp.]
MDKVRIDKYLWAIRVFKTRNLAKEACEGGKVKLFGKNIKPAHTVAIGEKYEINTPARLWDIEVIDIAERRMPFPEAIQFYKDHTPEEDKQKKEKQTASFFTGKRLSKTGKPTKRERRNLEDFLGG